MRRINKHKLPPQERLQRRFLRVIAGRNPDKLMSGCVSCIEVAGQAVYRRG